MTSCSPANEIAPMCGGAEEVGKPISGEEDENSGKNKEKGNWFFKKTFLKLSNIKDQLDECVILSVKDKSSFKKDHGYLMVLPSSACRACSANLTPLLSLSPWTWSLEERRPTFHLITPHIISISYFSQFEYLFFITRKFKQYVSIIWESSLRRLGGNLYLAWFPVAVIVCNAQM